MPFWIKYEKRSVVMKDGAVWKTKVVSHDWFIVGNKTNPDLYHIFDEGNKLYMWVVTSEYKLSPTKPTE